MVDLGRRQERLILGLLLIEPGRPLSDVCTEPVRERIACGHDSLGQRYDDRADDAYANLTGRIEPQIEAMLARLTGAGRPTTAVA